MQSSTQALADAVKIAPIYFSNSPDKQSYLRLINLTGAAGSVTITVRDAAGAALGTWTTPVNANTAPQLGMKEIEAGAKATAPTPVAGGVNTGTLEVTANFNGQLQHVVYNPVGGALTNLSLCYTPSTDTTNLTNVHTSLLIGNYPSSITLTNAGAAGAATMAVYDAGTGGLIGNWTSPVIAAGGTLSVSEAEIESALHFTPAALQQYHLIMKLTGGITGSLSHTVDNLISGVMTDMTARCVMGPA